MKIYFLIKKEVAVKILNKKEESQTIYVTENIVGYKHMRSLDIEQDEVMLMLELPNNATVNELSQPDLVEVETTEDDYIIPFSNMSDYYVGSKLEALLVIEPR